MLSRQLIMSLFNLLKEFLTHVKYDITQKKYSHPLVINPKIFLETKKNLGKQLTFANKRQLPVAINCGENEFKDNTMTIKNLKGVKGENNKTIPKEDLINEVKKLI